MSDEKNEYLYESKRLVEISDALRSLQKKSLLYLEQYQKSDIWKRFKMGFLSINVQLNPEDITSFEVCAIGTNNPEGFVSPETKKVRFRSKWFYLEIDNDVLEYD